MGEFINIAFWVWLAISIGIAYFLCGVPTAYVLGRLFGHVDVRTIGSGNIGSTNAVRAMGPLFGILTLALDVLKAVVAMWIARLLLVYLAHIDSMLLIPSAQFDWTLASVYLFCILGHIFSPYMAFKGGKGIAVGFGGALVLMPFAGLGLLVPFLIGAILTRYVSLGSILAAVSLPFLAWFFYKPTLLFLLFVGLVALVVIFAHRDNLKKLLRGEERKFSFKKEGDRTV